jgi:glutathione S-transferase
MKLYMHPVSMTSRPVRLFIAEHNIPVDEQVVDLMKGEHYQPPFTTLNPNRQVPVLEDEGFRLTESSAILKYLADKVSSPAYPRDLKQRAKVNEMMDWLNTQFYREYGYGFIYPQIFPQHKRPSDTAQQACLEWSKERAANWLKILDQHWLGPRANYLCGEKISIADYLGAGFVSLGEIIRMDFSAYPNVRRWLDNMKKLRSWPKVNEVFYSSQGAVKDQPFVTL